MLKKISYSYCSWKEKSSSYEISWSTGSDLLPGCLAGGSGTAVSPMKTKPEGQVTCTSPPPLPPVQELQAWTQNSKVVPLPTPIVTTLRVQPRSVPTRGVQSIHTYTHPLLPPTLPTLVPSHLVIEVPTRHGISYIYTHAHTHPNTLQHVIPKGECKCSTQTQASVLWIQLHDY